MDNDQVVDTVVPEGQTTPTEQSPSVQSDDATSQGQEAPEGTTYQELAAKKGFKSADDLAKAYANLEGHSTKVSQDKAKLEREFFSPKQSQVREPLPVVPEEQALNELDKFVKERTKSELQQIRAEFKEREDRRELRDTIEKHSDFGKYASDVKELKRQYPDMPFSDALLMAKAQKGDLATEARRQGATESAQVQARQAGAQVATAKSVKESKVGVSDLLQGAGDRWKAPKSGVHSQQAIAEIEAVEKELFGYVLPKTPSGI